MSDCQDVWSIKLKEVSFYPDKDFEDKRLYNTWRVFVDPNSEKTIATTSEWHKTTENANISDFQLMQAVYRPTYFMRFIVKESERIDYLQIANYIEITPQDGSDPYIAKIIGELTFERINPQFIYVVTVRFYKIEQDAFTISSFLSSDYVSDKFATSTLNSITFTKAATAAEHLGSLQVSDFSSGTAQQFQISTNITPPTSVSFTVASPGLAGLKSQLDAALVTAGIDGEIETFTVGLSIGLRQKDTGPSEAMTIIQSVTGAGDATESMGWTPGTYYGAYAINEEFDDTLGGSVTLYTMLEAKDIDPTFEQVDETIDGENLPVYSAVSLVKRKRITFCLTPEQLRYLYYMLFCKLSDIDLKIDGGTTTLNPVHLRDIIEVNENTSLIDLYEVNLNFPYEQTIKTNYFTQ